MLRRGDKLKKNFFGSKNNDFFVYDGISLTNEAGHFVTAPPR